MWLNNTPKNYHLTSFASYSMGKFLGYEKVRNLLGLMQTSFVHLGNNATVVSQMYFQYFLLTGIQTINLAMYSYPQWILFARLFAEHARFLLIHWWWLPYIICHYGICYMYSIFHWTCTERIGVHSVLNRPNMSRNWIFELHA